MSQQYPGQPNGAGSPAGAGGTPPGYGAPPGYGGPPFGQAGQPPGYGGGPGAGPPYGPSGPNSPGGGPPSKNNRVLLLAGIGCGVFVLLVVAAVVAGVFWLKSRGNAVIEELERVQASASAIVAQPGLPPGSVAPGAEPTGDCLLAYQCCLAIAAKSPSGVDAVQACEVFKRPAYPLAVCSSALVGYRTVAAQAGIKCE